MLFYSRAFISKLLEISNILSKPEYQCFREMFVIVKFAKYIFAHCEIVAAHNRFISFRLRPKKHRKTGGRVNERTKKT